MEGDFSKQDKERMAGDSEERYGHNLPDEYVAMHSRLTSESGSDRDEYRRSPRGYFSR